MTKKEMRKRMRELLRGIEARSERSVMIARRLAETEAWNGSHAILTFLSLPEEVDTRHIIEEVRKAGKTVAVPRIRDDSLEFHLLGPGSMPERTGSLGIREPEPSWPLFDFAASDPRRFKILLVVPGLAFDGRGHRLGRGKGYYDRFIREARNGGTPLLAIAVAFSEQLLDSIPHDPWDQSLDGIVTEKETLVWEAGDS